MNWLIAARSTLVRLVFFLALTENAVAVQGIGGGAIVNLGSIILGDLVTLAERGTYQGILILVWALAGAVGPTVVSTTWITDATLIQSVLYFRLAL